MRIIRGWTNKLAKTGQRGAVFGSLDGLHLGHCALINHLNNWKIQANDRESWLISLYPHPLKVLKGINVKQMLSLAQTTTLLSNGVIDYWQMLRFSKNVAHMSAKDFVRVVFLELCQLDYLVIGPDAAVGKNREGQVDFLKTELEKAGCKVSVVPELQLDGAKVGSRYIRAAIEAGDPQRAKELLGRSYIIEGKVQSGASRGRQIGFRTANISLGNYVVPDYGVYLVKAKLEGQEFPAIANVGVRPTFGASTAVLEVHFLQYQGPEFYNKKVAVEFIKRLRPEKRFAGLEELRAQITDDVQDAKLYFRLPNT